MTEHVIGASDPQTRCKHYHGELDIVAIKFKCCNTYYGCYYCHEEAVDHPAIVWGAEEAGAVAILCGACRSELTIEEYLNSDAVCPTCTTGFNPRCSNHYHFYFHPDLWVGK